MCPSAVTTIFFFNRAILGMCEISISMPKYFPNETPHVFIWHLLQVIWFPVNGAWWSKPHGKPHPGTASYSVSLCLSTKATASCVTGKRVETLYIELPEILVYKAEALCRVWLPGACLSRSGLLSREVIFTKHIDNSFLFYVTKYLKHPHTHPHQMGTHILSR